jgi:hypothetical protein
MIGGMKRLAAAAAPMMTFAPFGTSAKADESSDPNVIVNAISNCVSGQKTVRAVFNPDIESLPRTLLLGDDL